MNNWKNSIYLSAILFAALLLYCVVYFGSLSTKIFFAAIAGTGGFMLGVCFGMISAVRYLCVPRHWMKYRREIGIVGYFYALLYTLSAFAISPETYFADFPSGLLTLPSLLGIFAMVVLSLMFLISNKTAMSLMGFGPWKFVMRLGYIAYAVLVARAAMLEGKDWVMWLDDPAGLPPPRFVLSIFAILVVSARLSLIFSLTNHWGQSRA